MKLPDYLYSFALGTIGAAMFCLTCYSAIVLVVLS